MSEGNRNRVGAQMESMALGSKEFVGEHAMSSALVAFGLGVGTGIAIVSILGECTSSRHSTVSQRLGQQMMDAMSSVLPQSLMKG